jgi:hypothetical protein
LLNAFDDWTTGDERAWLAAELQKSEGETGLVYRVVVLHHGPFSSGPHGRNVRMQNASVPDLLVKAKVDLVLSGHDHLYERGFGGGLRYVVSGGGGAPLYPVEKALASTRKAESAHHAVEVRVDGKGMHFWARRADGSLLEECSFSKSNSVTADNAWDCDPKPTPPQSPPVTTPTGPVPVPPPKCACDVPGYRSSSLGRVAQGVLLLFPFVVLHRRRRTPAGLRSQREA